MLPRLRVLITSLFLFVLVAGFVTKGQLSVVEAHLQIERAEANHHENQHAESSSHDDSSDLAVDDHEHPPGFPPHKHSGSPHLNPNLTATFFMVASEKFVSRSVAMGKRLRPAKLQILSENFAIELLRPPIV